MRSDRRFAISNETKSESLPGAGAAGAAIVGDLNFLIRAIAAPCWWRSCSATPP